MSVVIETATFDRYRQHYNKCVEYVKIRILELDVHNGDKYCDEGPIRNERNVIKQHAKTQHT